MRRKGGIRRLWREMKGWSWTYRNRQVITPGQLRNFTDVAERSAHDDGLVAVFFVVVEDALHALDAGVLVGREVLLHRGLVPVEDAADERRNEEGSRLGARDRLHQRKHQRQVAVDAMLRLQDVCGLDAFPGRGDLDEDAVFVDADGFVELGGGKILVGGIIGNIGRLLTSIMCRAFSTESLVSKENLASTSVDTFPGMIFRISLPNSTRRRSSAESTFWSRFLPYALSGQHGSCCSRKSQWTYILFAIVNSDVHQLRIVFFLRCSQDQRRVGSGILRLVLSNGCKVTGVAYDRGAGGFELFQGACHSDGD